MRLITSTKTTVGARSTRAPNLISRDAIPSTSDSTRAKISATSPNSKLKTKNSKLDWPQSLPDRMKAVLSEVEKRGSNPLLVTFGEDAEKITRQGLGKDFQVVCIPHYANYVSKENYRAQVAALLHELRT